MRKRSKITIPIGPHDWEAIKDHVNYMHANSVEDWTPEETVSIWFYKGMGIWAEYMQDMLGEHDDEDDECSYH